MHDSLIINFISCISFNVYNQVIIHLLNAKQIMEQNLILLIKKKTESVPKFFFLKGKQINFFKLLYIYIYINSSQGGPGSVPKFFFLKGKQINFFKLLLYIYIFI